MLTLIATGLLLPARSIRIDGEEVADLGYTFYAGGYLLHCLLLLLGMHLAPDIGHPFVDLHVEVRHIHGTRILTYPRANAVLDFFLLLGDVANASPVPPSDEGPGGRVGVFTLGPGAVRILRPLMLRGGTGGWIRAGSSPRRATREARAPGLL